MALNFMGNQNTYNSHFLTTCSILQPRRRQDPALQRKRTPSGVDVHAEFANVFRLAILELLRSVTNALESFCGPLSGELDHGLGLVARELLAHDLARWDLAEFERHESATGT